MQSDVPTIPEEITELLEKRSTFREWLDRLEGREEGVRAEVYERVRGDYLERLSGVEEELAGHREELESSLARCRERVDSLEEERDERAADLEEAELRHAVGEYADEEWDELRGEHEAALAELEGRLEEERSATARFEEILAELDQGRAVEAGGEPEAQEAAAEEDAGAAEPETDEPGAEEPRTAELEGASGGSDEEPAFAGEVEAGGPDGADREAEAFGSGFGAVTAFGEEPEAEADETEVAEADEPEAARPADEDREAEDEVLAFLSGETAGASDAADRDSGAEKLEGEGEDFEDELDFLESLSLDDPSSLDTLSLLLDDGEEGDEAGKDDDDGERGPGGAS
ncbi:MAG TPA: hypothetical protein VKB18_10945 [Gemmatimonadota bacterium]|nr:hypothetical protein [Gemmatimonadota bacterium]